MNEKDMPHEVSVERIPRDHVFSAIRDGQGKHKVCLFVL
jgi:hypothetical protein